MVTWHTYRVGLAPRVRQLREEQRPLRPARRRQDPISLEPLPGERLATRDDQVSLGFQVVQLDHDVSRHHEARSTFSPPLIHVDEIPGRYTSLGQVCGMPCCHSFCDRGLEEAVAGCLTAEVEPQRLGERRRIRWLALKSRLHLELKASRLWVYPRLTLERSAGGEATSSICIL
jgi:hypothetical protein